MSDYEMSWVDDDGNEIPATKELRLEPGEFRKVRQKVVMTDEEHDSIVAFTEFFASAEYRKVSDAMARVVNALVQHQPEEDA